MRIRFGYVAIALDIMDGSPNKTITYTNLSKISGEQERFDQLRRLTKINLERLLRILKHNKHLDVHVFRMTSKLIPLATHPIAAAWDYCGEFREELASIGAFVRENKMRVSFHPDHFTLLNSPSADVVQSSIKTLSYHADVLDTMGLGSEAKLVLHIGGTYQDKNAAISRFEKNYAVLTPAIQSRIILENDDKSFTAQETLDLCEALKIPMVVDVHHHLCCNNGEDLSELWPKIMRTWGDGIPKIHFSSPKDEKNKRAHADFIDPQSFYSFLCQVKAHDFDFDVMLESKQKDMALFQLMGALIEEGKVKRVDAATIEL